MGVCSRLPRASHRRRPERTRDGPGLSLSWDTHPGHCHDRVHAVESRITRRHGGNDHRGTTSGVSRRANAPGRGRSSGQHRARDERSEEHTSELQSLMRTSYAVFCLKTKTSSTYPENKAHNNDNPHHTIRTNYT